MKIWGKNSQILEKKLMPISNLKRFIYHFVQTIPDAFICNLKNCVICTI